MRTSKFCGLAYGGVEDGHKQSSRRVFAALLVIWALPHYAWKAGSDRDSPLLPPLVAFALVALVQLISTRPLRVRHAHAVTVAGRLPDPSGSVATGLLRLNHRRGLLWFLMSLGFFVSVFGILQHLPSTGSLWFRVMRYGGTHLAPMVNRNHFAGFSKF